MDKPKNLAQVANAATKPPPEPPAAKARRRWVVSSFWLMVVFIGLPFWWNTTNVYRASLPYTTMDAWAEGRACEYTMPLQVTVDGGTSMSTTMQHVVQTALDDLLTNNSISTHEIVLRHIFDEENRQKGPNSALTVDLAAVKKLPGETPTAKLEQQYQSESSKLRIQYTSSMIEGSRPVLSSFLANTLREVFSEERAMISRLEDSRKDRQVTPLEVIVKDRGSEIERRQQRAMKYASTYHLTFSLFTPEATPSDWDIEAALSQNIRPLLKALAPICNFTVDTQVQPYAQFSGSVQPTYKQERKGWELKSSDLGGFINSAEWPLSPSIGAGPTINFLLYVPSASQTPLIVEDTDSASWLILQWGGIVIHNSKSPEKLHSTGTLTADELREPFLTFSQHLLDLLGLPSPDSPFQLRLQSQTRILALRLISSASSTLGSLARLTQTLTSISIPDTVATSVSHTVTHLENACGALSAGDFQRALDNAKTADEEAEKAFFHKSMVGQVYFPDEHKVAVYLPLLGPIAVPLVMTAAKELKAWLRERRGSTRG